MMKFNSIPSFQEDAPNNPVNSVISNVASYLDEEGLNDVKYYRFIYKYLNTII